SFLRSPRILRFSAYRIFTLFQCLELWLRTCGQRIPIDVQIHRDGSVPTHQADQIDDAALAEQFLRRVERRVAHLVFLEELGRKVINRFFIRRNRRWPSAFGDRVADCWTYTGLQRTAVVGAPLELRGPVTRCDDNRQLVQLPRYARRKTGRRAKL